MKVRGSSPGRSRKPVAGSGRKPRGVRDVARELDAKTLAALAIAAREDPVVFQQYVMRDEETGRPISLAPVHIEWQDILSKHDRVVIHSSTELGKAIPATTLIPTSNGWRTMGDLQVGDRVFDRHGQPCSVTMATPLQLDREVFRVTFDDGTSVLADADHRWIAKHTRPKASHDWGVVTTREMLDAGLVREQGRKAWKIPLAGAVAYPHVDLPLHPYVLGAWLGDGNSDCAKLTFHERDREIFDRCVTLTGNRPGTIGRSRAHPNVCHAVICLGERGVRGDTTTMTHTLRRLGVLDDKHIPDVYLRSSEEQRRELLAGLLDTDGCLMAYKGKTSMIEFSSARRRLADQTVELARSLGFKVRMHSSPMRLNRRIVGQKHRVWFTANVPVFKLARKLALQNLTATDSRAHARYVVAIDQVPSVPVKCIAVDSPDHSYLMDRTYTVTHNSASISVGRVLWEIGRNPNIRIVIISDTAGTAKKLVKAIKNYIERSPEYRTVFPRVVPDKDKTTGLWKDSAFHVRRPTVSKDPTVQAIGFEGALLGARADLIVIDDYLTPSSTFSQHMRDKSHSWLKSVVEGRKTGRARLWFVGNAWHRDDAMHRYAKERHTYAKKFAVRDENGVSRWPAKWSEARIEAEILNRGPIESRRSMFCDPASDAERRFKESYIVRALQLGDGYQLSHSLSYVPRGWRIVTGVDLAVSKKDSADFTALVTVGVDEYDNHQILDIFAARLSGPEIVEKIVEIQRRYHSFVLVESNAAQSYIKQFVDKRHALPIRAFNTGKNKHDPHYGIESLATEVSNGKWAFPNEGGTLDGNIPPEMAKLIEEMLSYDPLSHTGDRVMACWLAREGARLGKNKVTQTKRRSNV